MQYFVKRGQKIGGPFSPEQLKAGLDNGQLTLTDSFSSSREGPWKTLDQLAKSTQVPAPSSLHSSEGDEDDEDDFYANVANAKARPAPQSTVAPKETDASIPLKYALPIGAGVSIVSGIVGAVLMALFSGTNSSNTAAATKPAAIAAVNDVQPTNAKKENESRVVIKKDNSADVTKVQVVQDSTPLPAEALDDSSEIEKVVTDFISSNSAKEAFSCCVKEDAKILGTISYDGGGDIVTMDDCPSAAALAAARKEGTSIDVTFSINGEVSKYKVLYQDSGWKVQFLRSWLIGRSLEREYDIQIVLEKVFVPYYDVAFHTYNLSGQSLRVNVEAGHPTYAFLPMHRNTAYVDGYSDRKEEVGSWTYGSQDQGVMNSTALDANVSVTNGVSKQNNLIKEYLGIVFIIPDDQFEKKQLYVNCDHKHKVCSWSQWMAKEKKAFDEQPRGVVYNMESEKIEKSMPDGWTPPAASGPAKGVPGSTPSSSSGPPATGPPRQESGKALGSGTPAPPGTSSRG